MVLQSSETWDWEMPFIIKKEKGIYIYIYIYEMVTPGVNLKSYTFFKLLDLSRSNGQK